MSEIDGIDINDINHLNVYITSTKFHDPVLAKDGYIYERKAIVKRIQEQGTSPFTGELLKQDDLRSADGLPLLSEECLCEQPPKKDEKIVLRECN